MGGLLQDLKYALRSLRRSPGFAAIAVATLALGIAGSTAVFSVADLVFWRPLPFRQPDRLVRLHDANRAEGGERSVFNVSGRHVREMVRSSATFSGVAAFEWGSAALLGKSAPERVSVVHSSPGWWDVLGIEPRLGRTPKPSEEATAGGVALVSSGFWRRRLGGDARAIGRVLALDAGPVTVIGVMPQGFAFPYGADLWIPTRISQSTAGDYAVFARLRPGLDAKAAQAAMDVLAGRIRAVFPDTSPGYGIAVTPIRESLMEGHAAMTRALVLLVVLLLGIASVNAAHLVASRNIRRARELDVRQALGASPARLARQLAAEGLVLCGLSGAAGFASTPFLVRLLRGVLPSNLSDQLGIAGARIDLRIVAAAAATIFVAELFVGMLPVLHRRRAAIEGGLRTARPAGRSKDRFSRTFAAAQIGLALVLLSGAILVGQSLRHRILRPLGFDPRHVLAVQIDLPQARYGIPDARRNLIERLLSQARALPGAVSAGITTTNPVWGGTWNTSVVADSPGLRPDALGLNVNHRLVTPGFFRTLGIPLRRGRVFSSADRGGAEEVAIVSEHMARRLWPGADPIGRRVRAGPARATSSWKRVVGVVGDVLDAGDDRDAWYLPYAQQAGTDAAARLHLLLRTAGPPARLAGPIAKILRRLDAELVVTRSAPMVELYSETFGPERDGAAIVALFAAVGLALASIGTFGTVSLAAAGRTREFAIRMALGGGPADAFFRLEREVAGMAAMGIGAGAAVSVVFDAALTPLLAGSPPLLPSIAAAAAALGLCAFAAAAFPAVRTSRLDPAEALRSE
jgi:predicted permease